MLFSYLIDIMKKSFLILAISSIAGSYANYNRNPDIESFSVSEQGKEEHAWCTTSVAEQEKCINLMNNITYDKGLFKNDFIQIRCKQAFDIEECMIWADQGTVSLLSLDAGEVYVAARYHSLVPLMQEVYSQGDVYQYAVAVIKKGGLESVAPGSGLHGLRGARACFPRVGTLAGWVIPIHTLMKQGGLKITDCNNHVKSAIEYFGDSCAPNCLTDIYNPIGDNSEKFCKLCSGGTGRRCTAADPYAGYEGALRCLISDEGGDIAFVRDTTVQHALLSRKILGGVSEDRFELLCLDGSRRPVTDWESCNWGRVPADAIVTSSAASSAQRKKYQRFMMKLVELYGEPNKYNYGGNRTREYERQYPNYYSSTEHSRYQNSYDNRFDQNRDETVSSTISPYVPRKNKIESTFKLFHSNGTTDLLVQDATVSFALLEESQQVAKYILNNEKVGDLAEKVVGVRDCPVKRATICTTSDPEMEKCIKMRTALKAAFLSPNLLCYRGHSTRHCEHAVADGTCDFLLLDSADMLHAAAVHKLVPFMQEVYSSGNNWYYAVAVAKEQDPDTDITYLRGKNTCHTGINMAAGWVYPLAYLISNGWIRSYGCDGAHAAAEYFTKSCVPGALSSQYVDADTPPHENLCHLCHGSSYSRCRRDASEDYYGHVGALRCMVEGGGDVAFVRHTTPAEVAGGRRREWWARDLLPDDLQLLCPDGTRAKMHEYKTCNLGKVPGSVLMGRPNHTELDAYSNLMVYAQQLYGATKVDDFSFSMFYSQPPYSDLLFSDSAVLLKALPHNQRSAEIVAGTDLPRAARIVSCDAPQSSYYLASDPDFLSSANRNILGYILGFSMAVIAFLA